MENDNFKTAQINPVSTEWIVLVWSMGVGRGAGGLAPYWILKLLAKKGCFSISRGKKQISPLLAPPGKNFGKVPYCPPPWKKSFRRPWFGP